MSDQAPNVRIARDPAEALILDGCRGDLDLARRYVLSAHPFRASDADGAIEVTGPDIQSEVPVERWRRLMEFFEGNELNAATFLLRPLPYFEYRPLGEVANQGSEGLEMS